jgi:alpha-amylase/alpha-mannosidase (GH57 family)
MATVSFLWHLHQPAYRTADRIAHAPWVALHAGGAYTTLARAMIDAGGFGQVVNIVPVLLEQLLAYRDGTVQDPVVNALVRPVEDLDDEGATILLEWGQHINPRQIERSPRLGELASRLETGHAWPPPGAADLRDLQVLLILAHAGDQAWRDLRIEPLAGKGRYFTAADHGAAVDWLQAQPGELVELWRQVAELPGVEIATSPYAHPILPLLIDTAVVVESWAPDPAPRVPEFRSPEDARRQLREGLEFMGQEGYATRGCWPPEGAVSAAALALYAEAGVQWLVADERVLERSLDRELRDESGAALELYRPWRFSGESPTLFFRDRVVSDRIGFELGRWEDESAAAAELARDLEDLARQLPEDAAIVIALDGENPWPHYPACGGVFLRELMSRLNGTGPEIELATLTEVSLRSDACELARLHPGSWINGTFSTWIGHPEKTSAWELLTAVRSAVAGLAELPPSMSLAEGSDWFWWLGDDNPTELAPLYDRIFRQHLADACKQAGVEPPVDLKTPVKNSSPEINSEL